MLSYTPEQLVSEWFAAIAALGRRFYAAWHPAHAEAVLRHKNAADLAEWESREWHVFPGRPRIADVTDSLAAVAARPLESRRHHVGLLIVPGAEPTVILRDEFAWDTLEAGLFIPFRAQDLHIAPDVLPFTLLEELRQARSALTRLSDGGAS